VLGIFGRVDGIFVQCMIMKKESRGEYTLEVVLKIGQNVGPGSVPTMLCLH